MLGFSCFLVPLLLALLSPDVIKSSHDRYLYLSQVRLVSSTASTVSIRTEGLAPPVLRVDPTGANRGSDSTPEVSNEVPWGISYDFSSSYSQGQVTQIDI